jgi:hypothetical protein
VSTSDAARSAAGRLAAASRHHPDETNALDELRAELKRLRLTEAVEAAVKDAPPISPEMAIEIADLLIRGAARPAVSQQREAS